MDQRKPYVAPAVKDLPPKEFPSCICCEHWDVTPYAKRPTTDITTSTGHELMLLGFYLGMTFQVGGEQALCPEHAAFLSQVQTFKERQKQQQLALADMNPSEEALALQQSYQERLSKLNAPPPPPPKPIPGKFTLFRTK